MRRSRLTKNEKIKLAVFASGNGSNFEAVARAAKDGWIDAEIVLLICDKSKAYVLKRAERLGIPSALFQPKLFKSKKEYELALLKKLQEEKVDLIILAGYMRIIGETLLGAYPDRILNIHPSLLPKYPGRQGIKDAFEDKAAETGITVHLVDEGIDTGFILDQVTVEIESNDTLESLEQKIHAIEHELFPKVIQRYITRIQKEYV